MVRSKRTRIRRLPASIYDALGELGLVLFTIAVIAGFSRLFIDSSYFVPIVASAVSAHVLAAAVRWARGGLLVSVLVSVVGLFVSSALLYPPTTLVDPDRFVTTETLGGFMTDLELAWDQFQQVSAPAEVTAPFLLMIAIVMWVVAFLADWAAFRLESPIEALIPGSAVFVFGALFAAEQSRLGSAVLFVGAALVFVLFHRLGEASVAGAWLGAGAVTKGQAALLRSGLALLTVTLVVGVVTAPALPGYDEEPTWDISELDEPEAPRVVLSPLVDIRASLVNQPDIEVFTVVADQRDYWRITSLDVFDGRIWRSRGSFESASGELDTELPSGTRFESVTQSFQINALGGIWLPAAYEPAEILSVPDGVVFEYEQQSGTLIVNRDLQSSDGLAYTLLSALPTRDRDAIAAAGDNVPGDIAERYLELPGDFSDRVRAQAQQVVDGAGATSPYEKALALQSYFRDPALFEYDVAVAAGHSVDRLEDFLFEVRKGYCEQFSGAFAAMARSVGLPARVAVGFTTGDLDTNSGEYRVSGRHAHAWPEVWIDDIGWLRFEPTPGRGAPGDEVYTGVPEAQASDLPGNAPTTLPPVSPDEDPNQGAIPTAPDGLPQETTTVAPTGDRATSGVIGGEGGLSATAIALWVLFLISIVAMALTPIVFGVVRAGRRRRAAALDTRRRIGLAWSDSKSAVELLGVPVHASDTPRELVERATGSVPDAGKPLAELAEEVNAVSYSDVAVATERAERAEDLAERLAVTARQRTATVDWWRHHMNPVNVWIKKSGLWGRLRPRLDDSGAERTTPES